MDLRTGIGPVSLGNAVTAAAARAAMAARAASGAVSGAASGSTPQAAAAAQGFEGALGAALRTVSDRQQRAGALQREVVAGNTAVSVEETMIAMQKAQLSFQSALHVRNRMVQAYSDIMNMQV